MASSTHCFSLHMLQVSGSHTLPLFIRELTGKTSVVSVSKHTTVLHLKSVIWIELEIPIEHQRLIFIGKQLEDDRTIQDYGIQENSKIDLVTRLRGGKPIILLYPQFPEDVNVELQLCPSWEFSALYPKPYRGEALALRDKIQAGHQPQNNDSGEVCEWRVHAKPDGCLRDLSTGKEYPYLFWEADSKDEQLVKGFNLEGANSFCVAGDQCSSFLDIALQKLGLNSRERCDMVTYWLPQLESNPYNTIFFVDTQLYNKAATLRISPTPDTIVRVFMAFRRVSGYRTELDTATLGDLQTPVRDGFVAVEWGGMNLDGIMHKV